VAIDEAEAGMIGALNLDGSRGEPPLPTPEPKTNGANATPNGADAARKESRRRP
jgi:hypothetical protein